MAAHVNNIYGLMEDRWRALDKNLSKIEDISVDPELAKRVSSRALDAIKSRLFELEEYTAKKRSPSHPIKFVFCLGTKRGRTNIHFAEYLDNIEEFVTTDKRVNEMILLFLKKVADEMRPHLDALVANTRWNYAIKIKQEDIYKLGTNQYTIIPHVFTINSLRIKMWNRDGKTTKILSHLPKKYVQPILPAPQKQDVIQFRSKKTYFSKGELAAFDREGGPANYTIMLGIRPRLQDYNDSFAKEGYFSSVPWDYRDILMAQNKREMDMIAAWTQKTPRDLGYNWNYSEISSRIFTWKFDVAVFGLKHVIEHLLS